MRARNFIRFSLVLSTRCIAAVAVSILAASALVAEERSSDPSAAIGSPPGVNLLAADSLAGWDHDPTKPEGWTIEDGQLRGTAKATPLVSGYTVGDFELQVKWSVAEGGAIALGFPKMPQGQGVEIRLSENPGVSVRLPDGARSLKADPRRRGKSHVTIIQRHGDKLTLLCDGIPSRQFTVPADERFGITLAVDGSEETSGDESTVATIESLRLIEPAGTPMFNGGDFTGWWMPGGIKVWEVKDGVISWAGRGTNYLRSEKEYGNFTLSLEYKIEPGGNSGIGLRTPRNGWPSRNGMELQILDRPVLNKNSQMAIYNHAEALATITRSGRWNHVIIKADGPMITAWVNGELAQHRNTAKLEGLKDKPRRGWIGLQNHVNPVEFRNIHVLEAPDGEGLAAWKQP